MNYILGHHNFSTHLSDDSHNISEIKVISNLKKNYFRSRFRRLGYFTDFVKYRSVGHKMDFDTVKPV